MPITPDETLLKEKKHDINPFEALGAGRISLSGRINLHSTGGVVMVLAEAKYILRLARDLNQPDAFSVAPSRSVSG